MQFIRSLFFIFISLFVSGQAIAADTWYFGAAAGRSFIAMRASDFIAPLPPIRTQSAGTGFKAQFGYFFNSLIGAELNYTQFGKGIISNALNTEIGSVGTYAFGLVAVGKLPMTKRFDIGGQAGIYNVRTSGPGLFLRPGITYPRSQFDLGVGLFVQYMLEQNGYLRLSWDQIVSQRNTNTMVLNPYMFSLGVVIYVGSWDGTE